MRVHDNQLETTEATFTWLWSGRLICNGCGVEQDHDFHAAIHQCIACRRFFVMRTPFAGEKK